MQRKGNIVLSIVFDNNPGREDLTPAWGFACVIQGLDRTILFDTGGDGQVLLENMRAMRIAPEAIDAIVLSHPHGDHTGGLEAFLRARGGIDVYMAEGFPASLKEAIRSAGGKAVDAPASVQICPDALTTGTLGQKAIPEHGLCLRTAEGWLLITGCAHPGIVEMTELGAGACAGPVVAVMGGFHMGPCSPGQIQDAIGRLEGLGVRRAAPCHCSGDKAREQFERHFGPRCELPCVGSVLTFDGVS